MAAKQNTSARTIDLTSFLFVVSCGKCHPGGGPLEFDREGNRYDRVMSDPASRLVPGGENGLDGDYYQARWSESGVVEADCLICHLPEYDLAARNAQLAQLNFKWAATVGAGLGTVSGSVQAGEPVVVRFDREQFNPDGTLTLHLVREPRNASCLNCHAKSDWKKRGAAYSSRTDVHLGRGLRCVDCHTAASRAADERIRGKEVHQFGKGDDPGGFVRNDLDHTVRHCDSCHCDGTLGAPIADHSWLPPLHLEQLACQACHIPQRHVKAALVQAADVFNHGPYITPAGKRIWTFYDAERGYWNHYGENTIFRLTDQPTDPFRPTLVRYRGKIYPMNRIHSAFVGYEEEGRPGINQLLMKDFYQMWAQHRASPLENSPQLAAIGDDDGDGMMEVNRPEEIDALLLAARIHLEQTGFPLAGKQLVWVSDSRAYYSSEESRELGREGHEATAFASVFKYSHDVAPARAALGTRGCTDCHSSQADFFSRPVLDSPFGENGAPRWIPNHRLLGIPAFWTGLGAMREEWLKPALYLLLGLMAIVASAVMGCEVLARRPGLSPQNARVVSLLLLGILLLGGIAVLASPQLLAYMTVRRFTLDANHFWVAAAVFVFCGMVSIVPSAQRPRGQRVQRALARVLWGLLGLGAVSGFLMVLRIGGGLSPLSRLAYTGFDLCLLLLLLVVTGLLASRLLAGPAQTVETAARGKGAEPDGRGR